MDQAESTGAKQYVERKTQEANEPPVQQWDVGVVRNQSVEHSVDAASSSLIQLILPSDCQ